MILQALESHGDVFNMHTFIIIRIYVDRDIIGQ